MARASTLEDLRPPRPGGMGRGAMFAVIAHVLLIIALAFGVNWRSSPPTGATAELWAAVPEVAAPAAVIPPPAKVEPKPEPKPEPKVEAPPPPKPEVRDAEIALEKAKVEKAREEREERERAVALERKRQQEQAEKEAREKVAQAAKEAREKEARERAEAEKIEKQRAKNISDMMAKAGATGGPQSTGTAQRDAGPSANYAGKIQARVRPNIVLTDSVPPTLLATVELRVAPDGTITSRRLVKSSGNSAWDEAVLRAIDRTETLPKDENGRIPSPMLIDFKPA